MQHASSIINIGSILLLRKDFGDILILLKVQFCFEKVNGPMINQVKIPTFLNESNLDFGLPFLRTLLKGRKLSYVG
jgi:hypothetical protein